MLNGHGKEAGAAGSTLLFPSSVPAATEYAREARSRGERMIAASSRRADAMGAGVSWEYLPSIHDAGFVQALIELIDRHGVVRVYCPVTVVHAYLTRLIEAGALHVALINETPFGLEAIRTRELWALAGDLLPTSRAIAGVPALDQMRIAAVLRQANTIFGESYADKIAAMIAVVATAATGDIVEIGALYGRSAAVLATAAKLFRRSDPILVIDPWMPASAVQDSLPDFMRDEIFEADWEGIELGFKINLLGVALPGLFNYLALPSAKAFQRYMVDGAVRSPEFGETAYSREIGILHVDGNHDLKTVEADVRLWGNRLCRGGWIIFDDYQWPHGDGPTIVADRYLSENSAEIRRAFTMGGALFVQI